MIAVPMTVAATNQTLIARVSTAETLPCTISTPVVVGNLPTYTGTTEFTPSQEAQTIETANKVLLENITINPIPNNYGLVTWNGSVITVS